MASGNKQPIHEEESTKVPHEEVGTTNDLKSRVNEYGKKSLTPLIDLLSKYKGEFIPYSVSILKGLDAAIEALNQDTSKVATDQTVVRWLQSTRSWLVDTSDKMENGNSKDLLDYLHKQAEHNPGLMFSISYLSGMIFGRMGRYVGHLSNQKNSSHELESQKTNGGDNLH